MSSIYFINDRNEREGGFTIEQLQTKNIKPDTLVWYEGLEGWQKAAKVELLKPLFTRVPPPVSRWLILGLWYGRLNWIQKIALYFLLFVVGYMICHAFWA